MHVRRATANTKTGRTYIRSNYECPSASSSASATSLPSASWLWVSSHEYRTFVFLRKVRPGDPVLPDAILALYEHESNPETESYLFSRDR